MSIKACTLRAKWFPAGAIPQVLGFDIVTGITVRVVVMYIRFDGMPRVFLRHVIPFVLRYLMLTRDNVRLLSSIYKATGWQRGER